MTLLRQTRSVITLTQERETHITNTKNKLMTDDDILSVRYRKEIFFLTLSLPIENLMTLDRLPQLSSTVIAPAITHFILFPPQTRRGKPSLSSQTAHERSLSDALERIL
jgi:hypothetical protein